MRGLMLALAMLIAASAETRGTTIMGSGASSCGTWSADRRLGGTVAIPEMEWATGFLTGVGFMGASQGIAPLDGLDHPQGVWAWIDNYCQAHPIETIAEAAAAFFYAHPHR
jgi:hypothetical protein